MVRPSTSAPTPSSLPAHSASLFVLLSCVCLITVVETGAGEVRLPAAHHHYPALPYLVLASTVVASVAQWATFQQLFSCSLALVFCSCLSPAWLLLSCSGILRPAITAAKSPPCSVLIRSLDLHADLLLPALALPSFRLGSPFILQSWYPASAHNLWLNNPWSKLDSQTGLNGVFWPLK